MLYYFIDKYGAQQGPVELSKLESSGINAATPIWCEGMSEWKEASQIEEIADILKKIPPIYSQPTPPPPPPPINNHSDHYQNPAPQYNNQNFGQLGNVNNHIKKDRKGKLSTLTIILIILFSIIALLFSYPLLAFLGSSLSTKPQIIASTISFPLTLLTILALSFKKLYKLKKVVICLIPILIFSLVGTIVYGVIGNCSSFRYGAAKMKFGGSYGVINHCGERIISFQFSQIWDSTSGDFNVRDGNLYGLYSRDGWVIIPCYYDDIIERDNMYVVKKDGLYGIYSKDGVKKLEPEYYFISNNYNYGVALINKGGYTSDDDYVKGGKWGFIDKSGNVIVECKYDNIDTYNKGSYIKASNNGCEEYKYDMTGNLIETIYI